MLGLFFEPFIFENLPAADRKINTAYINEVYKSDIYTGLFGSEYGFEDAEGVSPTEREFDEATKQYKTRLIYVKGDFSFKRHVKMTSLIQKVGLDVIRKHFNTEAEIITGVYASLVNYLKEKEIIRTVPFDAASNDRATIDDLDIDKIKEFTRIANAKRGFPLSIESDPEIILTHLNLNDCPFCYNFFPYHVSSTDIATSRSNKLVPKYLRLVL